jgi:hypothetical protein
VKRIAGGAVLLIVAAAAIHLVRPARRPPPEAAPAPLPPMDGPAAFVGSESCKSCHVDRHETWLHTSHAYALREPSPEHVEGAFDGKPVEAKGFVATPYMRDGAFYVKVVGKDGRLSGDHRVSRVVGRMFEQAYLYTGPGGEWRVLPICWSIERKQWDLTHVVLADIAGGVPPSDAEDTRDTVFNHGCGQCHATAYDVGYDEERKTYDSRMLEGAVACESCHGPGSAHVAWRSSGRGAGEAYEAPARLLHPRKDLDHVEVAGSCGRCHYLHLWRYGIDDDPRVPHHDIAVSLNFDGPQFFADGRLNGLSYEGTIQSQSACYLKGRMSCLSCHDMHSGKRFAMKWEDTDDDAQCAQCHGEIARDPKPHTFHEAVRCVDCHMPRFLKGVLHRLRDHLVGNPEPELTERYGAANAPNACNVCHAQETAAWAREWKERWWGPAPRRLVEDVGLVVELRRKSKVETARLVEAAERRESRSFFRMTALQHLHGRLAEPAARASLRRLLEDPVVEIRQQAVVGLAKNPLPEDAPALARLLDDPVRTVRVEAAYALARCGWRAGTPAYLRAYEDARNMLVRQRGFEDTLERIALIADAAERPHEMDSYLVRFARVQTSPEGARALVDLLHRRGRAQTDAGRHADALETYARVRQLRGDPVSVFLYMDSADSLAALSRIEEAAGNWGYLAENAPKGSIPWLVARYRLAALTGPAAAERAALEAEVRRLEDNPAAGELVRRARYALRAG